MDLPASIKLGEKILEYEKLNKYQKAIYTDLVKVISVKEQAKTDVEKVKHIGVIEYLAGRLELYGTLTKIQNVYQHDELTPTT